MIFKRILGIAACDPLGVMGKNGNLPWNCPEDLKHFSDTTYGIPMIMGRRTFLSLPTQYFDGRTLIVFTDQPCDFTNNKDSHVIFVSSLDEFFALEESFGDLYVIGGAQIYNLFLKEKLIVEFILTRLKKHYEGDTFFPLSLLNGWSSHKIRETTNFSIHHYYNLGARRCI
jgi:dihydrofolate reductase